MFRYDRQTSFDSVSATSQEEEQACSASEEDSLLAAIGRDTEDEAIDLPINKRAKHCAATSQALLDGLRVVVAHFASWMGADRLSQLDMNILDNTMGMRAASPQQQHNQIAVACRRLHVAWRRMKVPLVKKLFSVMFEAAWPDNAINILDIMDIN